MVSRAAWIRKPVSVVVAAIRLARTSWLVRGRLHQFRVMKEKSRYSILFHLLVPRGEVTDGDRLAELVGELLQFDCPQAGRRGPLLPPASAVTERRRAWG